MNHRYNRQMRLPEIGPDGQQKLSSAAVLCVGAGGLGCPALLYLAAAGVGRIGIIDLDVVDETNLQRQVLFTCQDVGQPKATSAAARLKALNPAIQIEAFQEELNVESAERLFPRYDIILDGSDNFETKFLVNDASVKFSKPWVYGALQGFDGQACVFNSAAGSPCYRCLYPDKPKGVVMNCADAGIVGAVAGIVGVTQALQAIEMIVNHGSFDILAGKLWLIDGRTMQTSVLTLPKKSDCPVCNTPLSQIVLKYHSSVCEKALEIQIDDMESHPDAVLIDVREQEEWDRGYIPQALFWPLSKISAGQYPTISKERKLILYCRSGARSLQAVRLLKDQGHRHVINLAGGYLAWCQKNPIRD